MRTRCRTISTGRTPSSCITTIQIQNGWLDSGVSTCRGQSAWTRLTADTWDAKWQAGVTAGVFLGSTPDPTSWHYRPNQQIGGSFVNFEGGSYDDFHYTSTAGVALDMLKWQLDRPYLFLENGMSYRKLPFRLPLIHCGLAARRQHRRHQAGSGN